MPKQKTLLSCLSLVLLSTLLNAWFCSHWGFYADDWVQFKAIPSQINTEFWNFIFHELAFNGELRPFRAIEWLIKGLLLHSFGGLVSVYLFQSTVLGASASLLFLSLRRRFSNNLSFLIACVFLLSPIDSTSQWLATMHWKLSLLMACGSLYLSLSKKYFFSIILLICSLLFHEASLMAYVLFPLLSFNLQKNWKDNVDFRDSMKWFCICLFTALVTYIAWRLFIVPLYMSDFRVAAFAKDHQFDLLSLTLEYSKRWFYGFMAVFLLPIGVISWKMSLWQMAFTFVASLLLLRFPLVQYYFRQTLQKENLKSGVFLLISSLITISFFYWLALYQPPARHIGMDSKLNMLPSVSLAFGFVGVFVCLYKLIERRFPVSSVKKYTVLPLVFLLLSFLNVKFIYQQDYSQATEMQEKLYFWLIERQLNKQSKEGEIYLIESTDPSTKLKRTAIEAISYWGGPWSGKFKVYPNHIADLKPSDKDTTKYDLWYEGTLIQSVSKGQVLEINDKLSASSIKSNP